MTDTPLLSVVIPAYHEQEGLVEALNTIRRFADSLGSVEYIIIDDGSTDATWQVIQQISSGQSSVTGLRLSRNFGKEAAISAGLKAATGAAVITIDADLQHPPDMIPEMFRCWQAGAKVINTVKRTRENEGPLKAWMTRRYFDLFHRLAGIDVGNASDFKMLDREVVDCLNALPERERFYRGLVGWLGFEQRTLLFDVAPRVAGSGKWSSTKLIRLALDSIVSFSTTPMHLMTLLGAGFAILAAGLSLRTFWLWMAGTAVPGFSTVILLLIVVGSILMIGLGIIGIYIAKIYEEVKQRPGFIVQQRAQFPAALPHSDKDQTDQAEPVPPSGPVLVREVSR
ncbi:glycosyltransferase family 2 protein [uncultured Roseobacter sp.]|uniref:glycosyltransferase family 2 protein n=1 Tax=uncultured Roseobacter sp. TaxID=114847 RepID=UPI002613BB3B|nr:glycosyltransferase family 2 protein [uncultured Roseobacter sp.]